MIKGKLTNFKNNLIKIFKIEIIKKIRADTTTKVQILTDS